MAIPTPLSSGLETALISVSLLVTLIKTSMSKRINEFDPYIKVTGYLSVCSLNLDICWTNMVLIYNKTSLRSRKSFLKIWGMVPLFHPTIRNRLQKNNNPLKKILLWWLLGAQPIICRCTVHKIKEFVLGKFLSRKESSLQNRNLNSIILDFMTNSLSFNTA